MGAGTELFDAKRQWQWILLIVGVILFLISVFTISEETTVWWFLCNRIGEILVVGALIGFLSSHQVVLAGYRKELTSLFFDGKVICKRTDIGGIWESVSKQLLKSKFPNLHSKLFPLIRDGYLPTNEISYYSNYEDTISLLWSDTATGDLFVEHTTQFTLFTATTDEIEFKQSNWIKVPKLTNGEYGDCSEINMVVDGDNVATTCYEYDDENGKLATISTVILSGKTEYRVIKRTKKRYNINDDYHIAFRAKYITDQITVTLSLPDDIKHTFIECGTKSDFVLSRTGSIWKYQYKNLTLPRQGYIIILKPTLKE